MLELYKVPNPTKVMIRLGFLYTLPTVVILSGKNARAFLVCGFSMKSFKKYPENMKKIMGAIWKLPAK